MTARREAADITRAVAGQTLCAMFQAQAAAQGDAPALHTRRDGAWRAVSWREYARRVEAAALALMTDGLAPGQAVALLSGTREEYNIADLGVTHAGGIPVTLYQSLAPGQVAYIVAHAEAVLAFAENAAQAEKLLAIRAEIPLVRRLIVFEGAESLRGDARAAGWVVAWDQWLAGGDAARQSGASAFTARWQAVKPEAVATYIYPSGTTGPPKGAVLTHGQVCWAQEAGHRLVPTEPGYRSVGYLPMAHVAERGISLWGAIRAARSVYFCPAIERLGETLLDARPHLFFAVPRIWEKMHAALTADLAAEPDVAKREAARQALAAATRAVALEQAGQPVPPALAEARARADAALFVHLRRRLGLDEAKLTASGAAPIGADVLRFFHAIGLPILEVYGQTEGCGIASINRPDRARIGSVGLAYPGVEVRLAEDGEILLRGGNVFSGYHKEPALSAETVDADGWLHSGDIGALDADGFVSVVDRKKDIIITAGGKNITPSNIENALKRQDLISQAMVVGDRRPYLTALLTLDEPAARLWAKRQGLDALDWAGLIAHPALEAEVQREVDAGNGEFSRVEQVKRFTILRDEWSPATEELTPTLKVKRKVVRAKYGDAIEAMYTEGV